jgi:hypothetical protein
MFMTVRKGLYTTSFVLLAAAPACISSDSKVLDVSEGCDEYDKDSLQSLSIDADAKAFISATAEIDGATLRVSEQVFTACSGIAQDLGLADTWSGLGTLKEKISNPSGTGACDTVSRELQARVTGSELSARVSVAEGECRVDFEKQKACEAGCEANPVCEPGDAVTRCEPGKLSAYCEGSCEAESTCVGSVSVAANCEGECTARCDGECRGTCYREDGSVTENDPACVGKCSGEFAGSCFGQCRVTKSVGIECGSRVRCRGGCTGQISEPTCTTEYLPPTCMVDSTCYDACATRATEEAVCDPTQVSVLLNTSGNPELKPLADTLEKHLSVFYDAAKSEGLLIKSASQRMAEAGDVLIDKVDDLDGKALACISKSTSALSDSIKTLDVSIEASVEIKSACE